MTDINLDGKTALITGASQGIGLHCAKALLQHNIDTLVITARHAERLAQAADELTAIAQQPIRVYPMVCDHSERDDIDRLIQQLTHDKIALPNLIVANVGENPMHHDGPSKIHKTPYEQVSRTLTLNTLNTFYLLSQLLNPMRMQRFGRIVLVGTQSYQAGIPGQVAYNISKSALIGLKNTVVSEYDSAGIFCHLVNPGVVENTRTEKLRKRFPTVKTVSENAVAKAIIDLLCEPNPAKNGLELSI